jgi:hypothetical protein
MSLKNFYTKKAIGFVVVLILAFIFVYLTKEPVSPTIETPVNTANKEVEKIEITKKDIKEENFNGSTIEISGSSTLSKVAQAYVNESVQDFRERANKEVPDLKKEFGPAVSAADYSLEIAGELKESSKTESIIISSYVYTGGANGMSLYKVFTASKKDGHIVPIDEVISKPSQAAFVKKVEDELLAWKPEGMEETPVFKEEVDKLILKSMDDWAIEDTKNSKNFIIYFDKYEIGPGALGPVAFPISIEKVTKFLNKEFL